MKSNSVPTVAKDKFPSGAGPRCVAGFDPYTEPYDSGRALRCLDTMQSNVDGRRGDAPRGNLQSHLLIVVKWLLYCLAIGTSLCTQNTAGTALHRQFLVDIRRPDVIIMSIPVPSASEIIEG